METDKVVIEVLAPVSGVLSEIIKSKGTNVLSDEVIGRLLKVYDAEE